MRALRRAAVGGSVGAAYQALRVLAAPRRATARAAWSATHAAQYLGRVVTASVTFGVAFDSLHSVVRWAVTALRRHDARLLRALLASTQASAGHLATCGSDSAAGGGGGGGGGGGAAAAAGVSGACHHATVAAHRCCWAQDGPRCCTCGRDSCATTDVSPWLLWRSRLARVLQPAGIALSGFVAMAVALFILSSRYRWKNSGGGSGGGIASTAVNVPTTLALHVAVRAAEMMLRDSVSNKRLLPDVPGFSAMVFQAACFPIMYCWFYYPDALPKVYLHWITTFADMDTRLLTALRAVYFGKVRRLGRWHSVASAKCVKLVGRIHKVLIGVLWVWAWVSGCAEWGRFDMASLPPS